MSNRKIIVFVLALGVSFSVLCGFKFWQKEAAALHTIHIRSSASLKEFFSYAPDRVPFISAHRGGPMKGFPENCMATFENTLKNTWAVMEIDPHYTKDSAIVLMHDATLDRTSTGTGKVSDYTLDEIRQLKLKDTEGNITDIGIPTLGEALEWAKGKTILVLDMKDVPIKARVNEIVKHNAETHAIVMAYSIADAQKCYNMNKNILMEVMVADMDKVRAFDSSGVPWKNMVAFVSHSLVKDPEVFNAIHKRGAMCIVGSSRNYDRMFVKGEIQSIKELYQGYAGMITGGADIIEADLAIEAGAAIRKFQEKRRSSSKAAFFR
ncbi:MAG: glycerophosphodiester phosphodiesterase family protein [Chitinophagaceae bacterium]|nr:glycerophosphodiester phosphodiesterase family protein [Chitinophagaceae bacterium]